MLIFITEDESIRLLIGDDNTNIQLLTLDSVVKNPKVIFNLHIHNQTICSIICIFA